MKQFIYLFALATVLTAGSSSADIPLENIRVIDGDTIRAEVEGKERKIRLQYIDAPEMDQPFGVQSRNFLIRLLHKKNITVVFQQGEKSYGRFIGQIYANDESVNALMIKSGFAWVYDDFVKDSSSFLYELQDQARANKLGLWQTKDWIEPWNWRKQKRSKMN